MAHLNDKEEARNVRMVCYEAMIVKVHTALTYYLHKQYQHISYVE